MKKLASIVFIAGALVCAGTVPGFARESHEVHGRAVDHRGDHRAIAEHRAFVRHGGHSWGGWGFRYYDPLPYAYAAPPSYYCPAYGAYYPNVASCPVPWVTVP
jgi:hypothetical protein